MRISTSFFYSILVATCCVLTACTTSKIQEEVMMPPKDTGGILVKSVVVRPFSSNVRGFGEQLSREIIGRFLKEGHIQVSDQSAETTLTGELVLSHPTTNSYVQSNEATFKENKKKVKKTVYIYYVRKQVTAKVSYFLN